MTMAATGYRIFFRLDPCGILEMGEASHYGYIAAPSGSLIDTSRYIRLIENKTSYAVALITQEDYIGELL